MNENGSHVTWRELNLALDPIKNDVSEIKSDVKAMREAATSNAWLGVRGHNMVNMVVGGVLLTVLTTVVSVAVGTFIH